MISSWQEEPSVYQALLAFALTLLVFGALAAFLMPPEGDAEAFYLAYPKIIADSQRLLPMQGLYHTASSIGLSGEMHYAVLMMFGDVRAAKLFVWPIGLACIITLLAIAQTAGLKRRGQLLALVILLCSTTFTHYLYDGKTDLFACALGLAAYYWIIQTPNAASRNVALPVSGLLAGFAVVAKFSYLPALIPGLLLLLGIPSSESAPDKPIIAKVRAFASSSLVFGFWAMAAAVPHLIKNAVLFGEPLAPFIVSNPEHAWLQQVWFSPEITRRIVASYPFALTFGRYPMQGGNLSFLLLAFLPLALFLPRVAAYRKSTLAQITMAAVLGTVIWVIVRPSIVAPRYILATLLLFIPLAARAAEYVLENEARPRWLSAGIWLSSLAAMAVAAYPYVKLPRHLLEYGKGSLSECAMATRPEYCEQIGRINREAPAGTRVFLAGYYGYWLRPDLLQCQGTDEESKQILSLPDSTLRWTALDRRGFRYVVIDRESHETTYAALDRSKTPAGLRIIKMSSGEHRWLIYRLEGLKSGAQSMVACKQVRPPAWDVAK